MPEEIFTTGCIIMLHLPQMHTVWMHVFYFYAKC